MKVLQTGWMMAAAMAAGLTASAQKTASEITLVYDITVESGSNSKPGIAAMFNGATTTVYIKGGSHRTESVNSLGTSTTIYDGKTHNAVILKEYGNQKLLVRMTQANWKEANKKYEGISFTPAGETKTIAGYNCNKAVGKQANGETFTVYYTTDLVPENKEYSEMFKGVNGLVLQYEFQLNNMTVVHTASRVSLTTIPPARFEAPKTGYREMTWEESQKKPQ